LLGAEHWVAILNPAQAGLGSDQMVGLWRIAEG